MTYSAYVYGTIPAAKGKRGAILLLNFVLLPSLASCNTRFPAQPLFSHALPFLDMWQLIIIIIIIIIITITII